MYKQIPFYSSSKKYPIFRKKKKTSHLGIFCLVYNIRNPIPCIIIIYALALLQQRLSLPNLFFIYLGSAASSVSA